jgi:hypothetical protein
MDTAASEASTPHEQQPLLADGQPETTGPDIDSEERGTTFSRNLGAFEAFAIVISIVIGSGVFTSTGAIDTNVPSPGAALLVWLVGGVLAWTGASTLAELGTAIPGEGEFLPSQEFIAKMLTTSQVVYSRISSTSLEMFSGFWQRGRGSLLSCQLLSPSCPLSSLRAYTRLLVLLARRRTLSTSCFRLQ